MKTGTAFLCRALEDWSKIKRGGKEKKQMMLKKVETMLPAPYKLAGVAHLSMPKAMCESGVREGWGGGEHLRSRVAGNEKGAKGKDRGCQVPFSIFFRISTCVFRGRNAKAKWSLRPSKGECGKAGKNDSLEAVGVCESSRESRGKGGICANTINAVGWSF